MAAQGSNTRTSTERTSVEELLSSRRSTTRDRSRLTAISEAPSGCKEMLFRKSNTFAAREDKTGRVIDARETVRAPRAEVRGGAKAWSCRFAERGETP